MSKLSLTPKQPLLKFRVSLTFRFSEKAALVGLVRDKVEGWAKSKSNQFINPTQCPGTEAPFPGKHAAMLMTPSPVPRALKQQAKKKGTWLEIVAFLTGNQSTTERPSYNVSTLYNLKYPSILF